MESKHTPGPWSGRTFIRGGGKTICRIDTFATGFGKQGPDGWESDNQTTDANAALIAAAPAMYEALRAARETVDNVSDTLAKQNMYPAEVHWLMESVAVMRAALAKAEGR
jgi:hypothetical protein